MLLRICPSTNGYTMLHLCSCAIAIMNSTARRYPSYILKEHQARCCHERDASKGQAVLELVSSLLPYSIVVVHMSHPDTSTFTCAGVSSQRASSERGTVALGLAPATGPQKSPKSTKTPKVSKSKKRKEIEGVQKAQLRIPRNAWLLVMPGAMGASVAR